MRTLKTTLASCFALAAIGVVLAASSQHSSQPVQSGSKSSGDGDIGGRSAGAAKAELPPPNQIARADDAAPAVPADSTVTPHLTVPDLVGRVSRSIVRIDLTRRYQMNDPKTNTVKVDFAGEAGTGFVVRCDRVGGDDTTDQVEFDVVTNNHVLTITDQKDWIAPQSLLCSMWNLNVTSAVILGQDRLVDLAVIRARGVAPKGKMPVPLSWADPAAMKVGEQALAIGYAKSLDGRPKRDVRNP